MTLNEALQRVMTDRPGEATEAELEKWVNDLEVRWQQEQIDTHGPTFAEIAAAQAEAQAAEAEEAHESPSPIDTSAYGAGTNPSEMGWWVDDPEDIAGYYKIPTTDTTIVSGRQYFRKPPVEMVSPAYMSVWEAQADEEEEAEEEEEPSLLIQPPDDEVYIYWLYSKIDVRLGEIARYNNDAMMFNAAWAAAAKRYNRTHMPKGHNVRHIVYGSRPVPRPIDDPLDQRRDWYGWR